MNNLKKYFLPGGLLPSACLLGAPLLIMASGRLAHALAVFVSLLWIYGLSALISAVAVKIFPIKGRQVLLMFLTSFTAALFLFLLWLFSPLCAMELFFIVSFVPLLCVTSGFFGRIENKTPTNALSSAVFEAVALGALIVIFALIREPLGFLSLSLPGGAQGLILLLSFESESLRPVRIATVSSGALLLLGYCLGLVRYLEADRQSREENK